MIRNIYLVDDDDAVRASLHGLLSLRSDLVVRNFRSGDQFLERIPELESGVLLLDYHMPGKNGIEVLQQLGSPSPARFLTIILTGEGNIDIAVQAMKAGAFDFLEKPYKADALLEVIDKAFERVEHESAGSVQVEAARAKVAVLSPRERDVLTGLIEGRSNKIIAYDLAISPRTVEIYRANLMTKMGVRSLSEALRVAFAAGLIAMG
ncbi:response regulator transcription factor [Sphingomonas pruni]|jgi:two-component system response regulator FixJ|uniref:response regulator transcription factor n=1 Tax=Sphingomonas pruni TaxID=40683 RepID=UPI00082E515F|nr:response regulator [Sphingomonas pruni]